ncbi:MAG TPA: EamA family transporter [Candidatus Limnocylindrales bacterium]|nr:EamA family transporter [Candidatus Limnocylindrales bacterium]
MNRLTQARLQVLAAALLFSIGGAGIKACALTGWQVASFRSGIAAIVVWLLMPEARRGWTRRVGLVSLAYAATVLLFVLANRLTTSANTIFLQSTAPLYILLLGPSLLREKSRPLDLGIIGLIVLGLSFFFIGAEPPVRTAPNPVAGNILAAVAGVTWALTLMGLRWIGRAEGASGSSAAVVVAGNTLAFLIGLMFAFPVEAARPVDWAIVSGLGVVQIGIAYLFLTRAMRYVPALDASMLLLLEPALNPLWAWLIHGERPGPWSIAGGLLILGATVLKTWLDSRFPRNP